MMRYQLPMAVAAALLLAGIGGCSRGDDASATSTETAETVVTVGPENIAIASLDRPYGTKFVNDLWVEIYALRELRYQKMMKRAKIVPRPFVKLARRTVTPGNGCVSRKCFTAATTSLIVDALWSAR